MGCSSASRTWKVHRLESKSSKSSKHGSDGLAEALDEAIRREQEDLVSVLDTATVVSRSTSVRSVVSGVTSLHSSLHSTSKYCIKMREDMQSEVPAISESVADMDDLQEWEDGNTSTVIDNRQHPLAPSNISMYSADSVVSTNTPVFGDLGGCSDVPSVRDDASVASAPSEICLTFRGSRPSGSRCGSKEDHSQHQDKSGKLGRGVGAGVGTPQGSSRQRQLDFGSAAPILRETEEYNEGRCSSPSSRQRPRFDPVGPLGARRSGRTALGR